MLLTKGAYVGVKDVCYLPQLCCLEGLGYCIFLFLLDIEVVYIFISPSDSLCEKEVCVTLLKEMILSQSLFIETFTTRPAE